MNPAIPAGLFFISSLFGVASSQMTQAFYNGMAAVVVAWFAWSYADGAGVFCAVAKTPCPPGQIITIDSGMYAVGWSSFSLLLFWFATWLRKIRSVR